MYQIHCLNNISQVGTNLLTEEYRQVSELSDADAVLVRSAAMHDMEFPEQLLAVARAGAGVNNIPLDRCAQEGIVVFNTSGANANGVKELAICGMLLGSRDVVGGIEWVKSIKNESDIAKKVEKGKSQFAGTEILNKSLGVIGLGAIGGPLANAAVALGMTVYGYDPYISIDAAWHLDSSIRPVKTLDEIYENCDIITVHVPLLDSTRKMLNADAFEKMNKGVILLNFARDALVDDDDLEEALKQGKVKCYITDFPNDRTAGMEGVVAIPHLGASTEESEDNCAKMAVRQLMDYLENGNITNSVNYPNCNMGVCTKAGRITILHKNIPNMISRFTTVVSGHGLNISDMLNRSKGEVAYTMLDLDEATPASLAQLLENLDGVIRVRVIH
ncbi:MAG: phosphoglycerate dehydrogenase [Oscillospiraceae bacterium]|nr:phosphoglycerate dehydrogenase [Oscillospiraceae bacterium]